MKIFIIPFHVQPMEKSIMPIDFKGAYVSCYCGGKNYEEAVKTSLNKLTNDGLYPKEILKPILEMESSSWENHKHEKWNEYADTLVTQEEFEKSIKSGEVIYGPFGSYK